MSELKTLKEIEGKIKEGVLDGKSWRDSDVSSEVLRREAIKEIKFAKSYKEGTKGLFGGGIDFLFTKDVIEYIKWKFNITKEDLKNE